MFQTRRYLWSGNIWLSLYTTRYQVSVVIADYLASAAGVYLGWRGVTE